VASPVYAHLLLPAEDSVSEDGERHHLHREREGRRSGDVSDRKHQQGSLVGEVYVGLLLRKLSLHAMWLLLEDCLDDGGLFGCAGAEVAGRGVEGGVTEQGLDLRDVGATLA